jgi:4-amino-4-deoxy-L-arabinose transferase-like glycosyltransferase
MATIAFEPTSTTTARPALLSTARLALIRPRLGLALVVLLSAVLEFVGLTDEGYANSYYAAGVKSMLTSWHNFFIVSYDSGGFVSIDKPPLGLWIETASAKLFGFSGFSILLPEALAGVLSVALLFHLVARSWGPAAGLLAALALAVTPISVVTERNNTIDSLLILTLLLGAWAATLAAEHGRLGMLLVCAVCVGLGFNIKMLQAYLVLPAFALIYLFGAPLSWRKRLGHLALATVVLLVVSLAWAVVVDLTPASQRPFVSDSGTNSELSLMFGYNGLGRFTQALFPGVSVLHILGMNIDLSIVPAFASDIGNPGWFRLLSPVLGSQVSWLLPLALVGLVAATATQVRRRLPLDRRGQSLLLWGGWLLVTGFFFSTARFYHLYYLIMFAPSVAALTGIGLAVLWRLYATRSENGRWWRDWSAWLLPAALLVTAAVQVSFLGGYPNWSAWLSPLAIGGAVIAALVLIAGRLRLNLLVAPERLLSVTPRGALAAAAIGVAALLSAPTTWAAISVADGNGSQWLPQAGPANSPGGGFGGGPGGGGGNRGFIFGGGTGQGTGQPSQSTTGGSSSTSTGITAGAGITGTTALTGTVGGSGAAGNGGFAGGRGFGGGPGGGFGGGRFGGGGGGGAITYAGSSLPTLDSGLLHYLEVSQGKDRFLVATTTSTYASLFILDTNQPAMALGGYQGWDRIVTPTQLAKLVADGTVRFFYISAASTQQSATGTTGAQGTGTQSTSITGGTRRTGGQISGAGGGGPQSPAADTALANINNDLTTWIQTSCTAVPATKYQTSTAGTTTGGNGSTGGLQLYDCARSAKP